MTMLRKIEIYLRTNGIAPTRFGRDVVGDPRFVFDLRMGREPGAKILARVNAYLSGVTQ